ncbi:MAG: DUF348 domain-containing protein [Firmicutes bacterium]|nr:DUF348 domain-containing protein [Bacillota bacterium]
MILRKKEALPLLGIGLLLALLGSLYLWGPWSLKEVTIYHGADEIHLRTRGRTVADALEAAGLALDETYDIFPSPAEPLHKETFVEILAPSEVVVAVDGEELPSLTSGEPVGEILARLGVELGPLDRVEPDLEVFIAESSLVVVTRVQQEEIIEEEPIPYASREKKDPELEKGKRKVVQEGREGIRANTVRLTYEDGVLARRETVATRVVRPPQDKIIAVGTKIVIRTLASPQGPIRYREAIEMEATAYYPGPESTGKWADGFTATGVPAGYGVVAVDPSVIPLGTMLYIPGYGIAEAADVGGAIKGRRIDLCFDTYREAIHFGRRRVTVYVLE